MGKQNFYRQLSLEEAQDAEQNYEDIHYEEFYNLLFDQLLNHIKTIPFDNIIENHLQYVNAVYKTEEADSLVWLYTADRKFIGEKTIYSFRFANACHPEFYRTFETKGHHLFKKITVPRHEYNGWYKYVGQYLLAEIGHYLNIRKVVQSQIPNKTKLFINQNEERIDIQFNYSINERISISFEPGYPAIRKID
jgi:hypothetical protein